MLHNEAGRVLGLIVGIDEYAGNVTPLAGCVNDAHRMVDFLRSRVAAEENGDSTADINSQIPDPLTNEAATRDAIINGFRDHLSQAGKGDVAVFVFSGHGSQETSPEAFWEVEPDRRNETLICHDSRTTAWDLADKELGLLISEIAAKGAHVLAILDCCHSGSGTRAAGGESAVRFVSSDLRQRPENSYLFSANELAATRDINQGPAGYFANHVLLAACRSDQLAKEMDGGGQRRGAFSYCLLDTLVNSTGQLTYQQLFARVDARVRASVTDQSPQLEAIGGATASQGVFGGAIRPNESTFVVSQRPKVGWIVNAGALHGIQRISADDSTVFALFAVDTKTEGRVPSNKIGEATVTDVQPAVSAVNIRLESNTEPAMDATFRAVVIRSPVARLAVRIDGDSVVAETAREALQTASSGNAPSLYLRECAQHESPRFVIQANKKGFAIRRPADGSDTNGRLLVQPVNELSLAGASVAVRRLEALARWTLIRELKSHSSVVPDNAVAVEVEVDGEPVGPVVSDSQRQEGIRLEYRYVEGKWVQPQFRLKITNRWNRDVYCALLVLSDNFQVWAGLFPAGGQRLQPQEEAWALDGKSIYANVPKDLHTELGVTEYNDYMKIIVSTQEFDARLLEQPALDMPRPETRSFRSVGRDGTLNRLMRRVSTRNMSSSSEEESIDDWCTSQIRFTTVRPLDNAPVPNDRETVTIAPGVKVSPHPSLKAQIRLSTTGQSSRGLRSEDRMPRMPRLLTDDPDVVQPFLFSATRGSDPGLNVLELLDVQNHTVVTPVSPLTVELNDALEYGEFILPVAYERQSDGTVLFIPVGHSERGSGTGSRLIVTALPEPESDTRSLSGAVRIFCSKVRSKVFGSKYKGSRLAMVRKDLTGIHRLDDSAVVKSHVESATRVVLFIHGIIGDTDGMAEFAFQKQPETGRRIADDFLVLSYDYENLNTPVKETARDLKQKLEAVGLGAAHEKSLQIVAHSMGGLVSRWMIEHEGGNKMVERLIMAGTPNGGSPLPNVHDWGLISLGIGLNALSSCIWPAGVLAGLRRMTMRHDVTLDDMTPGSQFLADLAAGSDPGIPYELLAGNTSLPVAALRSQDEYSSSRLGRLVSYLKEKKLLHMVTDPLFLYLDNDIAVSVDSMNAGLAEMNAAFHPQEVGCDHLSYFVESNSKDLLASLLSDKSPS